MNTPHQLSQAELDTFLADHPQWQLQDNALHVVYSLPDFASAMRVVNQVADAAEELQHHPVWTNEYNKLTFRLSTHDLGGVVTDRDVALAEAIENIVTTVTQ